MPAVNNEYTELVVNCSYAGINPVHFGREKCPPSHSYGPAIRKHWLIHYVENGTGVFEINENTYKIEKGDLFVIPPLAKTYYEADQINPWLYTWIGFETDIILPKSFSYPVIKCKEAEAIFNEMKLCKNYSNGKSAFLTSCIWKFLTVLYERDTETALPIDLALSYIHSEYNKDLSVQDIADKVNLERCYFSRLFKSQTGMSPATYIRRYRLKRAAELMRLAGAKPSVAAYSVGYNDIFYFSKIFKQQFGVSPREYIKQPTSYDIIE